MVKKGEKKNVFDTFNRIGGILLHPTSLPSEYGIGELGDHALKFIDLLAKYHIRAWQILPLGPTGYGNSPYQSFSSFAGNPLIISIQNLIKAKLLNVSEIDVFEQKMPLKIDFGSIIPWKNNVLKLAFKNFNKNQKHPLHKKFKAFEKTHNHWLHDYALFMSIKEKFNNKPWNTWPIDLRDRNLDKLDKWKDENYELIMFHKFNQFLFFSHWNAIKNYGKKKNIIIIGDIPIFVALDSADVWANRNLFFIDLNGNPEFIAGVPPDLFSETGQRWGNPLYKWTEHKNQNYSWWKARFKHIISIVDIVRLDHFRGFEAYWEIPSIEKTAIRGKWVKGPGEEFFDSLMKEFKYLPIIAENLGVITEDVEHLRNKYDFPGMYILQFAFDDPYNEKNIYLPHNYHNNSVVYTGTHDNDTILGWYDNLTESHKSIIKNYFDDNLDDIADIFIKECIKSVANISIIPLQDVLSLDNSARMNFPGKENNNWEWKFDWNLIDEKKFIKLKKYLALYNRF
jgi:4-alpha-glucanotransferase